MLFKLVLLSQGPKWCIALFLLRVLFQHSVTLPLAATFLFFQKAHHNQIRQFFPRTLNRHSIWSIQYGSFNLHRRSLPSRFTGESGESKKTCSSVRRSINVGTTEEKNTYKADLKYQQPELVYHQMESEGFLGHFQNK